MLGILNSLRRKSAAAKYISHVLATKWVRASDRKWVSGQYDSYASHIRSTRRRTGRFVLWSRQALYKGSGAGPFEKKGAIGMPTTISNVPWLPNSALQLTSPLPTLGHSQLNASQQFAPGSPMPFEWDPDKARRNSAKHGVTFDEASTAFGDPLSLTIDDPDHSRGEHRLLLLGETHTGKLVVVAHLADDETIRIISARLAERHERRTYEDG